MVVGGKEPTASCAPRSGIRVLSTKLLVTSLCEDEERWGERGGGRTHIMVVWHFRSQEDLWYLS